MEITSIEPFIHYFDRLRGRTLSVFACVPEDEVEWRPAPGRFSFGDILRHLAVTERYMFTENAMLRHSRYGGHGEELAAGYENIVAFANRLHRESTEILSSLSSRDLQNKGQTPARIPITVWKWLRAMCEHEVHHRGQIYLMLGLLGVKSPPLFGLTAEQVEERSNPDG